jgi:hypothetical protein
MNAKKVGLWSIPVVILVVVIILVSTAMQVGGEASKLKDLMDADLKAHNSVDQVKQELAGMNYVVGATADPTTLTATGPRHSALIYSTWLTLKLTFNDTQKMTAYHIDRAGGF